MVLDGWGIAANRENNAIALAKTPYYDELWESGSHSIIAASEEMVGLPTGQTGNSEVGHMTIGAGRVTATDLVRISQAIGSKKLGRKSGLCYIAWPR